MQLFFSFFPIGFATRRARPRIMLKSGKVSRREPVRWPSMRCIREAVGIPSRGPPSSLPPATGSGHAYVARQQGHGHGTL